MPSAARIIVKDSHPVLLNYAAEEHIEPKGRNYDVQYSQMPGGIRIDEVSLGLELACVAITDDEPETLKKVGKMNPWQVEAMTKIMGSEEAAHKPLSEILETKFGLGIDEHLDISGFRAGYALDTQGYIAHNDDTIVLAYRCTTTGLDWLTNMSTSTSAWEHEDIAQGHSGYCSCMDDLCCTGGEALKPRVHTGFYNNFIASAPAILKYIDPLLAPDQPPRKLYVVGHSLGAGIATMAACYFLLQHEWENLPHRLVTVTAGGPRACCQSMVDVVEERLKILTVLDKAVFCRVVRDKDCVPTVPPEIFGFRHLQKLVYLTKDGSILINPDLTGKHVVGKRKMKELVKGHPSLRAVDSESDSEGDDATEEGTVETAYEKKIKVVPRKLRDHMPDFYLAPLISMRDKLSPPNKDSSVTERVSDDGEQDPVIEIQEKKGKGLKKLFRGCFGRRRKTSEKSAVRQ